MRRLGIIFGVLMCGLLVSVAVSFWPAIQSKFMKNSIDRVQEAKDLQSAEDLVNDGKNEEAKAIIKNYGSEIENFTDTGKKSTRICSSESVKIQWTAPSLSSSMNIPPSPRSP